jgi:hypothetical protein
MNTNRTIPRFSKASKKAIYLYVTLIGVILIALLLTGVFIMHQLNHTQKYKPPAFDSSAQIGEPIPPVDLGYTSMTVGQGFDIKICGRLFVEKNSVDIYFTNPKSNDVWLMTELQDENGKVLAKSGMIKQGEYIKSVNMFKNVTADKTNVTIVVIAYSPDTYLSRGSVSMKTVLFKQ